jgi:sec-independent protein translocase protein TatA
MGLDNPVHILLLLVVLLLVFGAKRLPDMGRSLGEGMRGFKESLTGTSPTPPAAAAPVEAPPPAQVAPVAAPVAAAPAAPVAPVSAPVEAAPAAAPVVQDAVQSGV